MRDALDWITCKPRRIVTLVAFVGSITVASIGLATWALIKSVITEQKVVTITRQVVRITAPSKSLRQLHLEQAIRDLTPRQKRQLLDELLGAATAGQLHRYGLAPFRRVHPTTAPGRTGAPQANLAPPSGGSTAPASPGVSSGPTAPEPQSSERPPASQRAPPAPQPPQSQRQPQPLVPGVPVPSVPLPPLPSLPVPRLPFTG